MKREEIDVLENSLRQRGDLLDILLLNRTTGRNIIWATDSYVKFGKGFRPKDRIKPELVTGVYGKLIQPRAAKSLQEQRQRTKDKAEVFTPLRVVKQMNVMVDWSNGDFPATDKNWQEYIKELRLEITCGEAPFIVSRYNPTARTGKIIEIKNRVGFLDRKLHVISQYCHTPKQWLLWAKEAYKASYGYEWQGDSLLIARENLLYTLVDYYKDKFGKAPTLATQQEFADIISWNIWQMDGIKYVIPMSCKHEVRVIPGELTLFGETPDIVEKDECEGCKFNRIARHNGKYAKTMDWEAGKSIKFVNLASSQLKLI